MPHRIKPEDLVGFEYDVLLASSSGKGGVKRLVAQFGIVGGRSISFNYMDEVAREPKIRTGSLYRAVEMYNRINEDDTSYLEG